MTRPRFLDQPYFSTRTPRTSDSQADYASPLQVFSTQTPWWKRPDNWVLAACFCAVLALTLLACAGLLPGGKK